MNMADVQKVRRPLIEVELDKIRHIEYTMDSMAELEEKFGSVDEAFEVMSNGSQRDKIFFIWAGLVHEDEELTPKQVGKLIGIKDLPYVMAKLTEAVKLDLPVTEEGEPSPN